MELKRLELHVEKLDKTVKGSGQLNCEVWGPPEQLLELYKLIDSYIEKEGGDKSKKERG